MAVGESCIDQARQCKADGILGLGGGSNMDLAKASATVVAHGGTIRDYVGDDQVPGPVLPLICLPTTAGTGSEVTFAAVLTDTEKTVRTHPLTSPWRCAYRNTSLTVDWLRNVADISKDTYQDLSRVNQARKDRVRLVTEN